MYFIISVLFITFRTTVLKLPQSLLRLGKNQTSVSLRSLICKVNVEVGTGVEITLSSLTIYGSLFLCKWMILFLILSFLWANFSLIHPPPCLLKLHHCLLKFQNPCQAKQMTLILFLKTSLHSKLWFHEFMWLLSSYNCYVVIFGL